MRYGTVPLVRRTGGLKDTVIDYEEPNGFGICFDMASVWDISYSLHRAVNLYNDKNTFDKIRKKIMEIDNSWEKSAANYIAVYQQFSKANS